MMLRVPWKRKKPVQPRWWQVGASTPTSTRAHQSVSLVTPPHNAYAWDADAHTWAPYEPPSRWFLQGANDSSSSGTTVTAEARVMPV